MKDEKYGMFLEWALLSQTQAQMNRDIFENMQQANGIPRLSIQICNTINTLDSMNWGNASSVNAASHVFIHEAPEFQKEVKEKENVFEKIRKALYTLVDELKSLFYFCKLKGETEMEELTREEAIRRHRLMWNWIADETERTHKPVTKIDAFDHFGWDEKTLSRCWCCEYAYEERLRRKPFNKKTMCELCPLDWSQGDGDAVKSRCVGYFDEHIFFHIGLFEEWMNSSGLCNVNFSFDQERFVSLARTIANLPEKKEVKEHD